MSASKLQKNVQLKGLPPFPGAGPHHKPNRKAGGGKKDYGPLDWREFFDEKYFVEISNSDKFNVYQKGNSDFVILLLHGGGYSALTWACFTEEISSLIDCHILAIDFRCHGDTQTNDDSDLSAEVLTNDIVEVFEAIFVGRKPPSVMIMGHSMGGAIAVRVALRIPSTVGLTVIDVVEGSAIEALSGMQQFLRGRPQSFQTLEAATEWCVRSGTVKNLRSARVSMPGQIIEKSSETLSEGSESNELLEEEETDCTSRNQEKTGVDRLDKELTVGQMQGKFQMVVLPKVGHALHEDSPQRVAEAIATFCTRNKLATAKTDFKPVYPGC